MTEAEAKTKWCPMAGVRDGEDSENCMGSKCGTWVWDEDQPQQVFCRPKFVGEEEKKMKEQGFDVVDSMELYGNTVLFCVKRNLGISGHCGLAR